MTVPRYAERAARLLRRSAAVSRPPGGVDPAHHVAAIERALAAKRRRRQRRAAALLVIAAAAVAVLWVASARLWPARRVEPLVPQVSLVAHPSGRGAHLLERTSDVPVKDGQSLSMGERLLVEPDGRVDISMSTGSELGIAARSSLEVREHAAIQRFFLAAGALEANVAKLGRGERFIIETPDAQVEVRGTRFLLTIIDHPDSCSADLRTHVVVREGVVEVRNRGRTQRVSAGQEWPVPCPAPANAEPARAPEEPKTAVLTPRAHRTLKSGPAPAAAQPSSSELAEQNRLFEQSLTARQRGDNEHALANYDRLITRYPQSALAENAIVDRMRLLRAANPEGARREARRYLAQYPHGFAKSEAERVLQEEP